ncbi:DUF7408 domain-containing protein [Hirschia baltica]|uniref:Glutamine amidotransferase domain-containing protein n=1 Tax=Hirschia baltica (strain ATCC 49814 / DSM 5838 / IFAM 1418) TaxID=582402 RepID=C6XPD9_HIRBI|nr:VWA domain-containing protein [Hirschia baltica]ACT58425.1 protein of unknown function DUF1355 [Hirschia baltica ATCC 49814]
MIEASRIGFDPFIPWIWIWGFVAVSIAVWVLYVFLRGRAWLTRALGFAILTLALSNPLWVKEQREGQKDIVAVVLDKSESMNFGQRSQTAKAAFEKLKTDLESRPDIELRITETSQTSEATNIYQALNSALSDAPRERIAGSILITDGQVHDLPTSAKEALPFGPVHSLIVGQKGEQDRRVEIVSSPNFGIVGSMAELSIRVEDANSSNVDVNISVNGERVATHSVRTGKTSKINVEIPRRGSNLIVAEVGEGASELTLANNRTATNISGVRDRLRVLLVTGEPHSGARVWRDLLKADPSVDLVHFTILRPPHKMDPTPLDELALISFPTRELFVEKLKDFDLVIFDQYKRINVLPMIYFDGVARYVADGGALLVATGPPYAMPSSIYRTPLAAILPAQPTGRIIEHTFNVLRTELGQRHTVTSSLPNDKNWGRWERYVEAKAASGEVLLKSDNGDPLLVLDRVGDGRVAVLLSDQLWMWARGHDGGGPYSELVRRTAHWLMKEPELEEELLTLASNGQQMKASLRSLSDRPNSLSITTPNGEILTPEWEKTDEGRFEASVDVDGLGMYTARAGEAETVALNGPANPLEYANVQSTTRILAPIADATHGGTFRIGETNNPDLPAIRRVSKNGDHAGENWAGLKRNEAYTVRSSQATPLLPGVIGMALLMLILLFTWRREGR